MALYHYVAHNIMVIITTPSKKPYPYVNTHNIIFLITV